MAVATITVTVDSQIGYIADFIPEQISSNVGVADLHTYSNNICNNTISDFEIC